MNTSTTAYSGGRLLRKGGVLEKFNICNSTLYIQVAGGLFPAPVKIGPRASAWPEREVDAVISARIAGKTVDQIKALVKELHVQRTAGEVM
ncbi:MAG: helix-turn-helix transcriptional regulator [Polaromonas sp.]